MDILGKIDAAINYPKFYADHGIKIEENRQWITVSSPFRDDLNPSFSVNLDNGVWKDHATGESGNVFTYIEKLKNLNRKEATLYLCSYLNIAYEKNSIKKIEYMKLHNSLLDDKKSQKWLEDKRGISIQTIVRFKLGVEKDRITIPIFDEVGDCLNIRKHSIKKNKNKVISYRTGYGSNRLFNVDNLKKNKDIILCEGELDCILLNQLGYNALTNTTGVGKWLPYWNKLFINKVVYICYDCDIAGIKGSKLVAKNLIGLAKEVWIVKLPYETRDANGLDITDYFVVDNRDEKDFDILLQNSQQYQKIDAKSSGTLEYKDVGLEEAGLDENYYMPVRFSAIVSGMDLSPFLIPRKIKITCEMDLGVACAYCPVAIYNKGTGKEATLFYTFDPKNNSAEILEMINISKEKLYKTSKRTVGIPDKCNIFESEVSEARNVQEIRMIPIIDYSASEQRYIIRSGFVIGRTVECNRSYVFKGITLPNPKTQYVTHLIITTESSIDSISSFKMTPEIYKVLSIFKPEYDVGPN
ncbi:hypothetical protein LCGC14_0704580 [marine sediment metagenome]|uniref:Zinc finger CHC2-type domain-containing protein n=1 Tax=marine sediment metagenome TaxID=412755 RepID=A0A0F9T2T7_9ZZZZ